MGDIGKQLLLDGHEGFNATCHMIKIIRKSRKFVLSSIESFPDALRKLAFSETARCFLEPDDRSSQIPGEPVVDYP